MKKSKSHDCVTCKKQKVTYYRNGHYFCGKSCFKQFKNKGT